MSRPFLFGGNVPGASTSKYLVEFRAGKMTAKGKTVHPIKKKGLVFLNQTEDSLMHFCWKDRTSGNVEDDLIIFPDDAEFKKVASCTTGRVFVLKFKSSSRRCFYWMQEPKEDKDDEFCSKINEYLNNPPTPGSRASAGGGSAGGASSLGNLAELGSLPDADLQNLLNNMNPQQLMQMLGGVGGLPSAGSLAGLLGSGAGSGSGGSGSSGRTRSSGATSAAAATSVLTGGGTPSVTTPTSSAGSGGSGKATSGSTAAAAASASASGAAAIQLSDLQSIISGLTVPQQQAKDDVNVDLSSSINYDALQPLLSNTKFMERVKSYLPPTVDSSGNQSTPQVAEVPDHLASTVKSPQFQQALSIFSSALQSGQLGPLMQQFDLSKACVEAANAGDLEAFVKALQSSEQQAKQKGGGSADKKGDDKQGDEMALD